MGNEESLKLAQQIAGVHGLHEQFVGLLLALRAGQWKRGQHGNRRTVGCFLRCCYNLRACTVALHTHVGNHHVILVRTDLHLCLPSRRRRFHLEAADFQHGLQRKQNCQLVINQ